MGRKKARPNRSGVMLPQVDIPNSSDPEPKLESSECGEAMDASDGQELDGRMKPIYVDIDWSHWNSEEHYDIAEAILHNVDFADGIINYGLVEDSFRESNFLLRFRLPFVEESRFRLGHWPVLSSSSMLLEYVVSEDVLFSGIFDGSDVGVSGLVHLVNQKLLGLRLIPELGNFGVMPSFKVRVEILQNAFDACESLLEIGKNPWRKSMMNVMSWLRPEVTTSEARYGKVQFQMVGPDTHPEASGTTSLRKHAEFDADAFYEAIKPSKDEPMLGVPSDLLPQLRPYQRRAAYWMVRREKSATESLRVKMHSQQSAPFCIPVLFLERHMGMFYNPFNGSVSRAPESSLSAYVSGGILADEMGLGKTVELLACIFTHRKPSLDDGVVSDDDIQPVGNRIKRQKLERIECVCGAASESSKYEGLWVQCDVCDAWQHADCVGFLPKKRKGSKKVLPGPSKYQTRKKPSSSIIEMEGSYICSLCSELTEASKSKISSTATLIVCPAPILAQWQSEITRHTRPGSLKICVYDGAKNLDSPANLKIYTNELANADIVLTTYDVLKEDLSHDSDRHDGDRRFMRFHKRYPVLPTLLTRIHWWRLCLDEAQMVECNTASVTEMAMRLSAQHRWCITGTPIQRRLDDLYGLLRFLRANPYDAYKWWVEVIRDPYEMRDIAAMEFVHKIVKQIMWRSSKVHVSEELQLPPQTESLSWLTFSQIEEHFYQKQHETCVRYAHEIIQSSKAEGHKRNSVSGDDHSYDAVLSHSEVEKLLFPLLKLRQACCHPQVGSSALCSLQSTPLTMEEILEVLINKTKIEGEEALRKIVIALNGLAALAVIQQDNQQAVTLYREALDLADENYNDFDLDPLLNLHIHHNLVELLPSTPNYLQQCKFLGAHSYECNGGNMEKTGAGKITKYYVKRCKTGDSNTPVLSPNGKSSEQHKKQHNLSSQLRLIGNVENNGTTCNAATDPGQPPSRCYDDNCLRKTCENIKEKFLSVFISKLSLAQKEFKDSHMQVCSVLKECRDLGTSWWLDALNLIERDTDSAKELMKKIDEAVAKGASSTKSSKVSSRFTAMSGLKYYIQNGLDLLETSRKSLIDRLIEIDQTMAKPRDSDIERVRYCPRCVSGNGSLCIHCELNDLFQAYEAMLFLLKKSSNGSVITSIEEALHLQKQTSELNNFFRNKKTSIEDNDGEGKKRHARVSVQVLKNSSILVITLGVIKSYLKWKLGKRGLASARKHVLLFEAMRKEFGQARCLSVAQDQLLRAHDEIKSSISRLRLQHSEDEPTAINVLSKEQVIPSSMQLTSDKFSALSTLAHVKGQLRYLKGLASKKKTQPERATFSSKTEDTHKLVTSPLEREENEFVSKIDDEPCPICREELCYQNMVFQCGHLVCCKCYLQMTEQSMFRLGKCERNWIMCPTCRQHSNVENIAYVDDQRNKCGNLITNTFQSQDVPESSLAVRGSYGTKIEAVTRRILWITSTDQEAKVLVFSSWNDVLDVLQHALVANDITYVRMKGGRKAQVAIARFKEQKGRYAAGDKVEEQFSKSKFVRVLLILIQHGANGLNLLEAQHVILVEPLLNPAAEAQAINRVHRIGQEKQTIVHRFIVKNTVEESIYRLNRGRARSSVMGINSKNQDKPALTIQDVESIFASTAPSDLPEEVDVPSESLSHLPPSVAAGLAAERRLMDSQDRSS